jgi:glycosyltransferase involved in cell wall biosynthesis
MVLDREFPPDIRVENEIDALVGAGHTLHIACYTRKNKQSLEKTEKITIHRKPISSFIYKSSVASLTLPFYGRFWKKFLSGILASQHFDALHIHDLPLVDLGVDLKKTFKVKLVADLHENWPAFLDISKHSTTITGRIVSPVFLWRRNEKKVLKFCDAVIVVVEEARKRLADLGIDKSKIFVVSNTINLNELKPLSSDNHHSETILYYAGGINYHRGLQNVINAMHESGNRQLKFMILGDGSYKAELVNLVEKLDLTTQVIFCGYQPFSKVMEMLSESDYALIPHLKTEHTDSTIPHKLFQYMYLQKPVIASDCLPIRRIIEETGAGVIYPSDNIGYLSKLLNELNSLNYSEMAARGKSAVIEKYNWNVDSEVLLNLYRKFLSF